MLWGERMSNVQKSSGIGRAFLFAVIAIVVLIALWHLLFPALGIAMVMTAGAWGVIVSTIVLLCLGALALFILPGIVILLVAFFAFIWVLVAIILFPFVFPLVVPLLILLWFVAYVRRRSRKNDS